MALLLLRIARQPFGTARMADLLQMTDRQIHLFYLLDDEEEEKEEEQAAGPRKRPPRAWEGQGDQVYQDPHHPLFKWDIPRPGGEAECSIDGRAIDAEPLMWNLVNGGLLKKEDVERVIREKREHEERLKSGEAPP